MKTTRRTIATVLALLLSVSTFSAVGVSPAYACGGPCDPPPPEPTGKANNGFGQEKRGLSDGTNNGSFSGSGGSPTQEATKTASTER